MKTIEQASKDYASSMENNDYTIETETAFDAGVAFAERWIDVNDRSEAMPANTDFLIKFEDGRIVRHNEDWSDEMQIVTHWRPIERI